MACQFPNELMETIFIQMNAENLMQSRKVCHRWNEIISKLERNGSLWLDFCLEEIPLHSLTDITKMQELHVAQKGNIFYHLLSKLGWIFWKEIFKEYVRARRVKNELYAITTIKYNPDNGQVTSLALNDLLLYSGFENGDVYIWKNIDSGQRSTKVVESVHCPVQAIFCDPEGTTSSKVLKGEVRNTESLIVVYRDLVKFVRYTSESDNKRSEWQLEVPRKPCENSFEFCPVIPSDDKVWFEWHTGNQFHFVTSEKETVHVSTSMDRITASDSSSGMVVLGMRTGDILYCDNLETHGNLSAIGHTSDIEYKVLGNVGSSVRQLINKGRNVVCLTDDSNIYVSINLSRFHCLDAHTSFGCRVECIAWHGAILAIGTKYGIVHVYHVPQERDLQNLDLRKNIAISLDCEHINAIAIGDDGSRPVIAVATDVVGVIHVIRW
eukprot:XP_011456834.1 PREDICTED: uncharacterized protein LOC105348925 [Crassostrea gigas]